MHVPVGLLRLTTLLMLGHASMATAWLTLPFENGPATSVAVDPAGNVVAAGAALHSTGYREFSVVALSRDTGTVLWQQQLEGGFANLGAAYSVATDAAGDVVAAGTLQDTQDHSNATVVKFAGSTGTVLWQANPGDSSPGNPRNSAIATVEAGGDVVGIFFDSDYSPGHFAAFRLDGTTGALVWRQDVFAGPGDSAGSAFALDVDSDLVVAGSLGSHGQFAVVKLALASGAEMWRYLLDTPSGGNRALAVARDANGDVVAAGQIVDESDAVKLAGMTGAEIWRAGPNKCAIGTSVVATASGDVFLGGYASSFCVARLAAATGAEVWNRTYKNGFAHDVALDPSGDMVAVGNLRGRLLAARFNGATGRRRWGRSLVHTHRGVSDDTANAVALDDEANPVVVGESGTGQFITSPSKFTVAKLCRKNGRIKDTLHCPL